jgi:Flp pilus assembly protein TadG
MKNSPHPHRRQQGAVVVTVALLMLFLLGFIGFALDFARTFVVKTELQTALDSCALSAAQELDGAADAITRAVSAGLTASNGNGVNFQSVTWDGKGQVTAGDITFRDGTYTVTTNPTVAKYAQCAHTHPSMDLWLIKAMSAFMGGGLPTTQNVAGLAVAKRGSAQTTCPVPLALKPKSGGVAPDYGFTVGEWVTLIMSPGGGTNGQIGWANLDGSTNAAETVAEMNGYCGTKVGDTLGTPGVQATVADNWNFRFGIYKNTGDPSVTIMRPDFTGYAYTSLNWPGSPPFNAYDGTTPVGAPATAANFVTKRAAFASCADTGTRVRGAAPNCEGITGLDLNSFQKLANPGMTTGGHRQYGMNRRIVVVPVVNGAMNVVDYACMFMLQPLSIPLVEVQLEYRGNAGAAGSPCTTAGLPGGVAGPLVPVLVR